MEKLRVWITLICAGNKQRKNIAMLDTDDENSSVSSSSTARSDLMSVSGTDEVQVDKDSLLEQALDALYEKRFVLMLCFGFEFRF